MQETHKKEQIGDFGVQEAVNVGQLEGWGLNNKKRCKRPKNEMIQNGKYPRNLLPKMRSYKKQ